MKNKSNSEIITDLKAKGYRVTVSHFRISSADFATAKTMNELGVKNWAKIERLVCPTYLLRSAFSENGYDISPRGGRTEVRVVAPDGLEFYGEANCSLADNYCRNKGITMALGRLVGILQELN